MVFLPGWDKGGCTGGEVECVGVGGTALTVTDEGKGKQGKEK